MQLDRVSAGTLRDNEVNGLYVFDPNIMQEHFSGSWEIPDSLKVLKGKELTYQFSLGPRHSGAPWHYRTSNSLV